MSTEAYIALAWIVTMAVLAGYSYWIIRRGKDLSARVPEEDRRWM